MTLTVRPGRARAGRFMRFRFRVHSPVSSCRSGASVRFRGTTVRADATGTAAVGKRLRRPGRYMARVTAPSCRSASVVVTVSN